MGVHDWDIETAISNVDDLGETSFEKRPGLDSFLLGWYYRWSLRSVYEPGPLEAALGRTFTASTTFFGLRPRKSGRLSHLPRVAVTTDRDEETHYVVNYDAGDGERHLRSCRPTWEAARATSAAPYYFTPFDSGKDGGLLIDGGLQDNNQIAIARLEARKLWSDNVRVDTLLSIGSGQSSHDNTIPSISYTPDWVSKLAKNYFSSMDGEARGRSARLGA